MSSSLHQQPAPQDSFPRHPIYRFALAFVIIIPIIILSIICALWLLGWLDDRNQKVILGIPIFVGTGGLSIALLMATWRDMTKLGVDLKRFIINKAALPPYYEFLELFAQLFLILIAIGSFKEAELPKENEMDRSPFAWEHTHLFVPDVEKTYLAQYPIVFENATINGADLHEGIQILDAHKNQIEPLLEALIPCARLNNKVEIDIIGYSSTRTFEDVDSIRSNELNVETANLRGQNLHQFIKGYLEEQDALENFDLSPAYIWYTYEDLERPIYDFEGTIPDTAQELLNRSAFINLVDAGACMVYKG